MKYASIIVDITNAQLDRVFTYKIPEHLQEVLRVGMEVIIPFGRGNRTINGYIVGFADKASYDEDKIKEIISVADNRNAIEGRLVALSEWMSRNYGSTMIQALRTVLPVKEQVQARVSRRVCLNVAREEAQVALEYYLSHNQRARARLMSELMDHGEIPYELLSSKLNVNKPVVDHLLEKKLISIVTDDEEEDKFGCNPYSDNRNITLNGDQQLAVDRVCEDMHRGINKTYLVHGVTGSGKTEVYIRIIKDVIDRGGSAIVLIPEIALTYQTVMRFYTVFGKRVSVMNSRLSMGERYDRYLKALKGEIDVMIGPRSALFRSLVHI